MKSIRHLLYILLVTTLAVSCVEERMPAGVQPADVPCMLRPSRSAFSFNAKMATIKFDIKSQNVSWELTGAPEWLTISQKSGSGDATVTLTATENKDVDNNRVAVLQLKSTTSKYEFSKSITVTQNAAEVFLNTSESSLTFAPQAAQKDVTVSTNVEWEAISSTSWLTVTKPTTTTLSLNASENTTAGTRTATITLRRVGTTRALATISVVQSEGGVTGSTEEVAFEVDGGTTRVNIEADVAWSATTSATSWLTITPTSGTGGKASLGITALASNSTAARSGYVYVNIGTTQKLAIPVSQEGISFDVTGTLENFAADGSDEQKLTVESNTAWRVLSCPEWLTLTPSQGNKGTCEITLQAAANNSLNSRSVTLRLGIEGVTVYKDITVTQEGFVTDLGDRSLDFGWESSQKELAITVPDSWSAMSSDDWLTLSQTSGNGGETIVVSAAENTGEDARTGTITVASEENSLKVSVIQQGQYLKINSTAGEVGAMGGIVSLTVTTTVGAAATVEYQGTAKDWVTFDADDKGNYTLSVVYNPSINSRTAQFVIKPTMNGTNSACTSGVKFAVTQKGRSLSANVSKIAISLAGGTSETYTITADGTYTITKPEADDWYTLQQDSTNSTFYIVAAENTTGQQRNSQLTVSLTGLPSGEEKSLAIEVLYDLFNGHEYVDLGLPSGIKWATCNVGATNPEEYGGYYAWGETEEKDDYSWSTYKWCNGSYNTLTKYCTDSDYGTVDNKTVLDLEDDVAHVKWGGNWRMPTDAELEELRNNCTKQWTTQNGVDGYRVTGPNGHSIFLPTAGYRDGKSLFNSDTRGYYWSNLLYGYYSGNAYYFYFYSGYYGRSYNYRYSGYCVRPVYDESATPVEKYTVTVSSAGNGSVAIKDKEGASAEIETGSTVTVVATPDNGYAFEGWYENGGNLVGSDAEYTFTVSGDIALTARFVPIVYEAVDLGLPSGIKWATFNVGATRPEEYGGYYAWGETEEKDNYIWSTYKWCNGSSSTMTKYCTNSSYGTVDNKTTLDLEDDVAHVKWGGSWRMPTKAEQDELRNNCTWTWTTQNDVNGCKVTGPNGNSIFLPAAGHRDDTNLYNSGSNGYYWSSSLYESRSDGACYLGFSSSGYGWDGNGYRYSGRSVRPVCGAPIEKYTVTVGCDGNGSVAINGISSTSATFEEGTSVAVVATPDEGYTFDGWYANGNEIPVSTSAEYSFTVSEDVALTAKFEQTVNYNGHEYVDLGLPSGLKWAICNVGATKPEEYGGYYAWGETEEKENYSWSTYKWCNGSSTTMTKYCTIDNKTFLDPEDDVARVKWGSLWRIPTREEQDELRYNCTWQWTTVNNVKGCRVTGPNGNSIFLPAGGYRRNSSIYNGGLGHYWSSSYFLGISSYDLGINNEGHNYGNGDRAYGHLVRPVYGEQNTYTVSVSSDGNGVVAIQDRNVTSVTIPNASYAFVVATPNEGYSFEGWYVDGRQKPVAISLEYSFVVNENVSLVAKFRKGNNSASINNLSQLDNNTIVTITSGRAFLMYSSVSGLQGQICSSTGKLVGNIYQDPNDVNQQFRIVKSGDKFYLYSMGAGKYVDKNGNYTGIPTDDLTLENVGGEIPWKLMIGGNVMNSQVAGQLDAGIVLNSWTTTDSGNCYMILVVDAGSE